MLRRATVILIVGVALLLAFQVIGAAQEEEQVSPKNPLLYGVASFVIPGSGQFLNGETNKALTHFLVAVAIPVVGYYAALASPTPVLVGAAAGVAQLGWAFLSAMDAYRVAQRFNEAHGLASLYMKDGEIGLNYALSVQGNS